MKVNLSRLLDKIVYNIDISDTIDIDKLEIGKRILDIISPIEVKGRISKTDDGNYIDVNITCEYRENCDRCLKEYVSKIEAVLSGRLIEKSSNVKADEDEETLIYYQGDNILLEEPVISTIILSLPMKSLCKEGCEGLCPVCGIDLNKDTCNCEVDDIDPRFAKLKELFD